MTLQQLKYVVAVAEKGTISKASKELFVSQPSLTNAIRELEKEQLRTDLPKLEVGDLVRVYVKVVEGNNERLQAFEGTVIKVQGGSFSRFSGSPDRLHPRQ